MSEGIRLDKWLWAARFFKARSQAQAAIEGGKIHYNDQRAKSSREVEVGAQLAIRQGVDERRVIVKALSAQRRSGLEAQQLYEETPESIAKREQAQLQRQLMASHAPEQGRPNKKQRREIIKFKYAN